MTDTAILATPALLDGYCGPCEVLGEYGGVFIEQVDCGEAAVVRVVDDGCEFLSSSLIRLDLTQRLAYFHTLAVVAERVGLDPSGGVMLIGRPLDDGEWEWRIEVDGACAVFAACNIGHVNGRRGTWHVPDLPASPYAYPQALAAIWRALEAR